MDYALGWGTLALLNAALANVDGRAPLTYFVGSLFFGPLMTIVLAVTWETPEGRLRPVDLLRGRAKQDQPSVPDNLP